MGNMNDVMIHKSPLYTPVIYNITCTVADTEYSQALPSGCTRFQIKTRDGSDFRLAFVTGKVAGSVAPYYNTLANEVYSEVDVSASGRTLYFASDDAGAIIEIIAWSP